VLSDKVLDTHVLYYYKDTIIISYLIIYVTIIAIIWFLLQRVST